MTSIPRPTAAARGTARSADGTRIAWKRYGRGEPAVLFVPTWNLVDSRVVGHQVVALEPHATVITYDPRGAGESERPASGYGFAHHAADALAVLDANGIERAAVLTASRGLNAAVVLASDHPGRVVRIASIGSYMVLDAEPAAPDEDRLASLVDDWPAFIIPFMHRVFNEAGSKAVIEEMVGIGLEASPVVVAAQERELDWSDPAHRLPEIPCPTLLIHGGADATVPPSLPHAIANAMPDARVTIVAAGGHRPDIRSPELVNPMLLDFLLEIDNRP